MNKTILTLLTGCVACAAGMVAIDQDPVRPRGLSARNSPLRVVEPDAADLNLRMTPVVMAVRKADASVVSIYILNDRRTRQGRARTEGQGSGVILDEAGLVITNWHVVAAALDGGQRRVQVRLKDGRSLAATIMSSSSDADLALLQLDLPDGETVQPVVIGDSSSLMVGETVIAIGNPQGHANTVTQGVLSAIGRSITVRAPDGVRRYRNLLQTDAAINQGNSGGALLDITGKLIGINNAMAVGSENIGFAIPVDRVREVFENDLLSSENLTAAWTSAWLGVRLRNEGGELVVSEVHPLSPAQQAGLRVGDQVLEAGQTTVQNTLDYARGLLRAEAGQPFHLRVQRGSRTISFRPVAESFAHGQILDLSGMILEEITYEQDQDLVTRATMAFWEGTGRTRVPPLPVVLRVSKLEPGGPADELGLEPGDVLFGLNFRGNISFDSRRDLADKLQGFRGEEVDVLLLRDDKDLWGPLPVRG
jgi:serine protease Do